MTTKVKLGDEFNYWTLLEKVESNNYKQRWKCKCICGTIKEVLLQNILRGTSKSCGCLIHETFWKGHGEISSTYWSRLKADALRRDLQFNISIEDSWDLFLKQNRKCALSGVDIKFAKNIKEYWYGNNTASLDRIDSSIPYIIDNIQWVHKDVNKLKNNFEEKDLLFWCERIYKNLRLKENLDLND